MPEFKEPPVDFKAFKNWILHAHMPAYYDLWQYLVSATDGLSGGTALREAIFRLLCTCFADMKCIMVADRITDHIKESSTDLIQYSICKVWGNTPHEYLAIQVKGQENGEEHAINELDMQFVSPRGSSSSRKFNQLFWIEIIIQEKRELFPLKSFELSSQQIREKMRVFFELISQLLLVDGETLTYQIIRYCNQNSDWSLEHLNSLLRLLVIHYERLDFQKLDRWFQLNPTLKNVIVDVTTTYVKPSVDTLDIRMQRFISDPMVAFSLSQTVLLQCRRDYESIQAHLQSRNVASPKDQRIAQIGKIIQALQQYYQITPNETQLFALLAFIHAPAPDKKGVMGQIKTGEGKSIIIAMLAVWYAMNGHVIDIVTSSDPLASRDCDRFQKLFQGLGFTSAFIDNDTMKTDTFQASILYGTNSAFEFAYLREGLNPEMPLRGARPFDIVIVDEADNLFIDAACHSARISHPSDEDVSWVFPTLVAYVMANPNPMSRNIPALRIALQQKNPEHGDAITALSEDKLVTWMQSAQIACYVRKERKDYIVREVVKKGKLERLITIVDFKITGNSSKGSQWQDGIHQCLQAKHGCRITPLADTAAAMTHHGFFTKYKMMIGLTGTIGDQFEREEIERTYQLTTFDVPPHLPSLFVKEAPLLELTSHHAALHREIQRIAVTRRPMLFLFETISAARDFSDYLASQHIKHLVLDKMQSESDAYVLSKAGELDSVLIATNIAGRGTDIILSEASQKAGGLHVVFTFFPTYFRVEQQGFGRAARQGQPGSGRMILNGAELGLDPQQCVATEIFQYLEEQRQDLQQKEVQLRAQTIERDAALFSVLEQFFNDLRRVHKYKPAHMGQLKTQWARFFSTCCKEAQKHPLPREDLQAKYVSTITIPGIQ